MLSTWGHQTRSFANIETIHESHPPNLRRRLLIPASDQRGAGQLLLVRFFCRGISFKENYLVGFETSRVQNQHVYIQ